MPASGNVLFMPWVTLPRSIRLGSFRFCPIETSTPASVVDSDIADTISKVLKGYVGRNGKPIQNCTIVLRTRHHNLGPSPRKCGRTPAVLPKYWP
jgi:hypothetical protein